MGSSRGQLQGFCLCSKQSKLGTQKQSGRGRPKTHCPQTEAGCLGSVSACELLGIVNKEEAEPGRAGRCFQRGRASVPQRSAHRKPVGRSQPPFLRFRAVAYICRVLRALGGFRPDLGLLSKASSRRVSL